MLLSGDRLSANEQALIERALRSASDTRLLLVQPGIRHEAAGIFRQELGSNAGMIVADENTFAAAGRDVRDSFQSARQTPETFIFGPTVYADDRCVSELTTALKKTNAIPVAVWAGPMNDLT